MNELDFFYNQHFFFHKQERIERNSDFSTGKVKFMKHFIYERWKLHRENTHLHTHTHTHTDLQSHIQQQQQSQPQRKGERDQSEPTNIIRKNRMKQIIKQLEAIGNCPKLRNSNTRNAFKCPPICEINVTKSESMQIHFCFVFFFQI